MVARPPSTGRAVSERRSKSAVRSLRHRSTWPRRRPQGSHRRCSSTADRLLQDAAAAQRCDAAMRPIPEGLRHGPFTHTRAHELGVTERMLRGARFRRIFPRVWVAADHHMTDTDWLKAARLALPQKARLTGITRIQQLGLDFGPRRPLHFVLEGDLHLGDRRDLPASDEAPGPPRRPLRHAGRCLRLLLQSRAHHRCHQGRRLAPLPGSYHDRGGPVTRTLGAVARRLARGDLDPRSSGPTLTIAEGVGDACGHRLRRLTAARGQRRADPERRRPDRDRRPALRGVGVGGRVRGRAPPERPSAELERHRPLRGVPSQQGPPTSKSRTSD